MKIAIMLTATIDPSNVFGMARLDTEIRIKDYVTALSKWLKVNGTDVFFCENSGNDIRPLMKKKYIEEPNSSVFITFNGQGFNRELGKGFGELATIEYLFNNNKRIMEYDYVVKVNGRYYIKNIEKILRYIKKDDGKVYVYANLYGYLMNSDSRVFIARPAFYKNYLITLKESINDSNGVYFEHILNNAILSSIRDGNIWNNLPLYPYIEGISGTTNKEYSNSLIKNSIRSFRSKTLNLLLK